MSAVAVVKSPTVTTGSVNADFEQQPILGGQLQQRRYQRMTLCDGIMYLVGTMVGAITVFAVTQIQICNLFSC